jgi:hypothetical protein
MLDLLARRLLVRVRMIKFVHVIYVDISIIRTLRVGNSVPLNLLFLDLNGYFCYRVLSGAMVLSPRMRSVIPIFLKDLVGVVVLLA